MNKKFLSAILFGALMVTSTGTFVSCKDYDDDIDNLQTQIDKNSTAIAELQKLVGAGNWVTNIAGTEAGLVVTMSNGSSTTIPTVNGKNGTEWTIGTDGYWYKDGEKTANVAVGKDGITAPSPQIENGYWVVYNWDAEKGEFVAETTEVPAAGTSAYVVKASGVYTLHIADENGEMVEVSLPATSDAIIVEAPYKHVDVKFEVATWNKWTSAVAKSDAGKALVAKYPEIANIKNNASMKQGGRLPLIVTPAAVELTDEYNFSLQNVDGSVADIALSAPAKGADMYWSEADKLNARSASETCIWSLAMEPAYDKKKYVTPHYAATKGKASLIVENEAGTVVRTAFAYTVSPVTISGEVAVVGNIDNANTTDVVEAKALYAESIDLFAPFVEEGTTVSAPISFNNEYNNHYIIAVANVLQAEMYGLSIAEDGHTLNIAKMSESDETIKVKLSVVALGLNGSVAEEIVELTIGQEIVANEGLTPAEVTLSKKNQIVAWDFEELGLSAVAFDKFYGDVTTPNAMTLVVTREADKWDTTENPAVSGEDGELEKYVAYNGAITYYNAKGKKTEYEGEGEWSNDDPVKFGFELKSAGNTPAALTGYTAEGWTEAVYEVTLKSTTNSGNTVVYAAKTELTVKNPELTADYVKVVSAFLEDGIAQITGSAADGKVTYDLNNVLATANGASIASFIDYDNYLYSDNNEEDYEFYNWVGTTPTLSVSTWVYEPEDLTDTDWIQAAKQQLYQVRNIRAMVKLFNADNLIPYDFQIIVKSEIYSEDGSTVTFDAAKLKAVFVDDADTEEVYENQINVTKAITAKAAAGEGKGKTYNLFSTKDSYAAGSTTTYDYSKPETMGDYIKGTDGNTITFSTANAFELQTLKNFAGDTNADVDYTDSDVDAYQLKTADWTQILTQISGYVNNNGNAAYYKVNNEVVKVKYRKFSVSADGNTVKWENDSEGRKAYEEKPVYLAHESAYLAIASTSGKSDMTKDEAQALKALTVIPKDDETAGIYVNRWIALFNAYKGSVKCKSTTAESEGTTTYGTARDARIADVKVVFDEPEEAAKFFTNTIDEETGVVFHAADASTSADYAGDFILKAKEAANVTVTGGKVVVALKLIVTDNWGMIMEIPFNVEVSTVK